MKTICKHFSGGGNFETRTQLLKGFVSLLLITTAFTSCTNESEVFNQSSPKLDVKFGVALPQARAILNDECLPDNSKVGVALDDGAATVYDGYSPLYFTSTGTGSSQTWTSNTDVAMTSVEATLYAYYPYDGNVDISAIPIDMTAADQTDWLYATPVANVNEDNASVAVTLNHALANINVSLVKGSYVGTGNVTAISVKSDGIAPKGTFNAVQATPDYTAFEDEGAALERTVTTTLGGTATDIMVVPTGESASITFNITMDGQLYIAKSTAVKLEIGNSYKYTVTFNSTYMSLSEVAVTQWNEVDKGGLTPEKDKSFDLKTAPNGVYAVTENGRGLLIEDADESCIAVALIVNDIIDTEGKTILQKFMIEKNASENKTSAKAAYQEDDATNTGYYYFYWGPADTDVNGIENWTDGNNMFIPIDYKTWKNNSSYVYNDFNGKSNTAALMNVTDNDSNIQYGNMGTWCRKFNETPSENQGYTDWYIPASGQLALILINSNEINAALTKIGGNELGAGNLYSSSEYDSNTGWCQSFGGNKYVQTISKDRIAIVRFIRDIN